MTDERAITTINDDDLIDAAAEAAEQNLQPKRGMLLLYKKGKYTYGQDRTLLPLGTELVAIIHEIRFGHVKWGHSASGKPKIIGTALGRLADRFKPNRDVLGELDESQWPYDDKGNRTDPWLHTVYTPMISRDGSMLFTFSTHSFFGREAAYGLQKDYAAEARNHRGCYPVVRLDTTTVETKSYGDVHAPTLEIVGWQDKPQYVIASAEPPIEVDESEPGDKPPKRRSGVLNNDDMDDDIPF